eukprot:3354892-Amphidinium_carterae.1
MGLGVLLPCARPGTVALPTCGTHPQLGVNPHGIEQASLGAGDTLEVVLYTPGGEMQGTAAFDVLIGFGMDYA